MFSVKPLDARSSIAICWGAYPFRAWDSTDPILIQGVVSVFRDKWNKTAGGFLTAVSTPYESYWMYHATILLMGAAGIGKQKMEEEIIVALEKNVSPQGLIPEQISRATGMLWGCAPLSVAQADLLLYAYRKD